MSTLHSLEIIQNWRGNMSDLGQLEMVYFTVTRIILASLSTTILSSRWQNKGPHLSFQQTLFLYAAGTYVHEDSSYSSLACHTADMQMVHVHYCVHPGCGCWDLICWQNSVNNVDTWHWDGLWQSMHNSQVSLWHRESDQFCERSYWNTQLSPQLYIHRGRNMTERFVSRVYEANAHFSQMESSK